MVRYKTRPTGASNTNRPLTHPLDFTKEGLAMNATQERWKSVVGYEGFYEVSDCGRVRSVDRIIEARDGRRIPCVSRILSPGNGGPGSPYLRVSLTRNSKSKTLLVHRLVLESFVGPSERGWEGCHGNGVPTDNRLVNLRWDSSAANSADTMQHGNNWNTRKTHCSHGHRYTEGNIRRIASRPNYRFCKACDKARTRAPFVAAEEG